MEIRITFSYIFIMLHTFVFTQNVFTKVDSINSVNHSGDTVFRYCDEELPFDRHTLLIAGETHIDSKYLTFKNLRDIWFQPVTNYRISCNLSSFDSLNAMFFECDLREFTIECCFPDSMALLVFNKGCRTCQTVPTFAKSIDYIEVLVFLSIRNFSNGDANQLIELLDSGVQIDYLWIEEFRNPLVKLKMKRYFRNKRIKYVQLEQDIIL